MQLPRIKAVHAPELLLDRRIRIGTLQYGVGAEIDDQYGIIWPLLGLLDGSRTIEQVIDEVVASDPSYDRESLSETIETLADAGYVEDAAEIPPAIFSPDELERYSRNFDYFAWIDTSRRRSRYELQVRLKEARVTVAGLGGAGSSLALNLVGAGIGAMHCVDFDNVELSNLNRQTLFTEEDIGAPKVHRALDRLRRLNNTVEISGDELLIKGVDDVVPLMERSDLFILCADKPEAEIQAWVNEAALRTGTPWLLTFYAGPMVVTGIFVPRSTPCFACLVASEAVRPGAPQRGMTHPGLRVGQVNAVIAPTAALSGGFGALEAIYFLAGLPAQTVGRLFHQNLLIYDHTYYITPSWQADCPACGGNGVPVDSAALS